MQGHSLEFNRLILFSNNQMELRSFARENDISSNTNCITAKMKGDWILTRVCSHSIVTVLFRADVTEDPHCDVTTRLTTSIYRRPSPGRKVPWVEGRRGGSPGRRGFPRATLTRWRAGARGALFGGSEKVGWNLRRTVDRVNSRGRTWNFRLKRRILMFNSFNFKFQGALSAENFTRKPMKPLLRPQSFV